MHAAAMNIQRLKAQMRHPENMEKLYYEYGETYSGGSIYFSLKLNYLLSTSSLLILYQAEIFSCSTAV